MLHKLLKVECVSPTLPVTASHLHALPTSVCQICTSKQGQHFLFWRKETGGLEPLLMGYNLEEELAPDPHPVLRDIHKQRLCFFVLSPELKDTGIPGSGLWQISK